MLRLEYIFILRLKISIDVIVVIRTFRRLLANFSFFFFRKSDVKTSNATYEY